MEDLRRALLTVEICDIVGLTSCIIQNMEMKQITEGFSQEAGGDVRGATEGGGEPAKAKGGDVPLNQFGTPFLIQ